MASPQILRHFLSCYDTCSTNDPSFIIGCWQVRFLVLIFDHSATTYSALDLTPVQSALDRITQSNAAALRGAREKGFSSKIKKKVHHQSLPPWLDLEVAGNVGPSPATVFLLHYPARLSQAICSIQH